MKSYWWPAALFVVAGVAAYLMQRVGWIPGADEEAPVPHDEVSWTFVGLVAVLAPLLTLFRRWSNRKAMDAGQNLRARLKDRT